MSLCAAVLLNVHVCVCKGVLGVTVWVIQCVSGKVCKCGCDSVAMCLCVSGLCLRCTYVCFVGPCQIVWD